MRFIKNTLLLLVLFITNITISQNMDIAKAYYIKAKEAYSTNDYTKAIEYIESTKKELGGSNPDITYLEILARCKLNKKDELVKSLSHVFLENADRSDDRIEEVSLIVIEHDEIINKEIIDKQNMYNSVIDHGSVDQIRAFLYKYPNGEEAGNMKLRLEKKETEIYTSALAINSVKSYTNYLSKFPTGKYLQEINDKLKIAKEVESYYKAKSSEDISFIEGHLLMYPASENKTELLEILESQLIQKANKEFNNNQYAISKESYLKYLDKFPEGQHIDVANANLKIVQKKIDKQSRVRNQTSANYFMLTYASDETYGIEFGKLSQNKVGLYFNLSGNEAVTKLKFSSENEIETVGSAISLFEEASISASLGLTYKIIDPVWIYAGVGLKYREFQLEEESWDIQDLQKELVYPEGGLKVKIGKIVALKAGAAFIDSEIYFQAGIGILTKNW